MSLILITKKKKRKKKKAIFAFMEFLYTVTQKLAFPAQGNLRTKWSGPRREKDVSNREHQRQTIGLTFLKNHEKDFPFSVVSTLKTYNNIPTLLYFKHYKENSKS